MRAIVTNCTQGVASNIPMPTSNRDFTSAMRAHQPKLYRTACFLTGDHHEGEDLLQETLLEAWKSWNSFEDRSAVYTWVYRILIRRYHRWQRRQILRRIFFVSTAQQKESQTFIDPSELPGSLMEHAEQKAPTDRRCTYRVMRHHVVESNIAHLGDDSPAAEIIVHARECAACNQSL